MTASVIGALRANLGLDSAKFETGAKRAGGALREMRRQFLLVSGAASALGGAILVAARKGADEIDRVAKSARRMDASTTAFQSLRLAADEAGVPLSALANDIQSMNREIANIGVSGNADRALERLGLTLSDLEGLDADEKIALMADRVKELGLSAGEATAILRDMGVRNREVALLMLGGGEAIRAARKDIEDYGLAISDVDSAKIEAANDAISRLGLVSQYLGRQLALSIVPALGDMARAITDSLREGGNLRAVLDGLVSNLDRLAVYVSTAVTWFGVRYVSALVAAKLATLSLAGAMATLGAALRRVIFVAAIAAAGELVIWFTRLVRSAGGFGEAIKLLSDVAKEAFARVRDYGDIMGAGLSIIFNDINDAWTQTLISMSVAFGRFVDKIAATKAGGILGFEGGNEDAAASAGASATEQQTDAYIAAYERLEAAQARASAPFESIQALRDFQNATDDVGAASEAAAEGLASAEEGLDDAKTAAGGAGGAAKKLAESLTPLQEAMKETSQAVGQELTSAFTAAIDGTKSVGDALLDFANNTLAQVTSRIFQNSIGNPLADGITSIIGSVLPGIAAPAVPAAAMVQNKSEFNLNIRNEAGVQVETSQRADGGIDMILKAVAGNIGGGGVVGAAIDKTYKIAPGLNGR